jgi:prepilin-type processing-associated H-X9-DG protein
LILPYLDQKPLYDRFDLNSPWDSPQNRELLAKRPWVYESPDVKSDPGATFYQVFIGAGTAFESPQGTTLKDFPDGTDKTLLVVEAAEPVPWTKPIDLPYMAVAQLPPLGGVFKAGSRPFDVRGADGFHILFADGSVQFVYQQKIQETVLRALVTRNGAERIDHTSD